MNELDYQQQIEIFVSFDSTLLSYVILVFAGVYVYEAA